MLQDAKHQCLNQTIHLCHASSASTDAFGAAPTTIGSISSSTNQQTVQQRYSNELHATAVAEVEQCLPPGRVVRTFEGCRADLGFGKPGFDLYLPLHVKARVLNPLNNCFIFNQPRASVAQGALLWLCRPSPSQAMTLVIPEGMTPRCGVGLTLKKGTKYYPFLVLDNQLPVVLSGIYDEVMEGEGLYILPTGQEIDISGLRLMSYDELSTPTSPDAQQAREFFLLRNRWLPTIDFVAPDVHGTIVDAVVEGVRLADAVARPSARGHVYMVDFRKCTLQKQRSPAEEGDLDALWVYHPDKVQFWLIPAHVLVEKGILATPQQPGKKTFELYDSNYTRPKRGAKANAWSQLYVFDSRDPALREKIVTALKAAHSCS